ncbi:NAD(P)-binding domain-containing protein [Haloechinothrix sp. LS1_15]|uniref:NAD(P)-dependent oxidoreductase n=1 Tax=Haloechinothrix sp. LS1_15 TaxID=2652248 RepID=UPI0029445D23|nr:NAD(P)-binding domain-containing protein [Haloechinothrix sp. LS1_15]MDV6013287.1 NAD(P)-dependent oxidoreductase [Haloechinothrix sp. LS1_15]
MTRHNIPSTTVIGLGPMGSALARTLLASGAKVTVWNRSAAAAERLQDDGAVIAPTVRDAVDASELVLVCLRDHEAVREVLHDTPTAVPVVNFTSATPTQARDTARWAAQRGIERYVTAAIMVPVPLIGTDEAVILYSGDESAFRQHHETLRALAGNADFLGDDHGLAPLFDVGMLEVFFAGMTSFVHAAAMARRAGEVSARSFLPYALGMLSILPDTLDAIAGDIDAGAYSGEQDRVEMEHAALEHIVETGQGAGLDTSLAASMRDLAARTVAAGDGHLGWSKVYDHLAVR